MNGCINLLTMTIDYDLNQCYDLYGTRKFSFSFHIHLSKTVNLFGLAVISGKTIITCCLRDH